MDVFERVDADLEAGRLWKARDRLHGYLASAPADQKALDLLGEVLFRMGDLPGAGAYWFMTERTDADSKLAGEALVERQSSRPDALLSILPIRAPIADYPPGVQERLRGLAGDARSSGAWRRSMQPARKLARIQGRTTDRERGPRRRITDAAAIGILILGTVGVWLAGVAFLSWLVVRAVI
jgi:hypothetical protein